MRIWQSFLKMLEFAMGEKLFPFFSDDELTRDLTHLAQMMQCTGQRHNEKALQAFASSRDVDNIIGVFYDIMWWLADAEYYFIDKLKELCEDDLNVPRIDGKLFASDPNDNLEEERLVFHKLVRDFLNLDPAQRPTARQALENPYFATMNAKSD